ncbi:hypothetical protein CRM22_011113 [Opisthorchis felineus]|uniref:Uncharacterized protein n=1 Tax=Opisthorchis felineus TaxID=147828 RepID=A0A4S2KFB6_OPIFE|nr:hypothetical protein CRM22_011113 [Opisthorchis felineus]
MDSRLEELLQSSESLVILPDRNRIKCLYTGHEMPFDYDVISRYLSGVKFRRACANKLLENHKDYIVDVSSSKAHLNQLFCKLTWRYINKDVDHLIRHFRGRKFQQALGKYLQCKESGNEFAPTSGKYKNASYFKESNRILNSSSQRSTINGSLTNRRSCSSSPSMK